MKLTSQGNYIAQASIAQEKPTERPAYCNGFLKRRCVVPVKRSVGGRPEERRAIVEYSSYGRRTLVDGRTVQLLETYGLQRPPNTHCCYDGAKSRDGRIHNRMPVILQDDQIDTWLDPSLSDPRQLGALLKAPQKNLLDCYPVSRKVNSVPLDKPEYRGEGQFRLLVSFGTEQLMMIACPQPSSRACGQP